MDKQIGENKFKDSLNAILAAKAQDKKLQEATEATEAKGDKLPRATQVSDVVPRIPQGSNNFRRGRLLTDIPISLIPETTAAEDKKRVKMHNTALKNIVKKLSLNQDGIEYKNLCIILDDNISRIPNEKHAEIALKYLTDNARKVLDNNDYIQSITNMSLDMLTEAAPSMAGNDKKMPKKTSGANYNTQDVVDATFSIATNLDKDNFLKVTNHFLNSADLLGCMTQKDYTDSLFVKSIYNFSENQVALIVDSKQIAEKHLNFLCKYNIAFQEYNAKQQSQDVATPTESTTTKALPKKLPRTIFLQQNPQEGQPKPSRQAPPPPVALKPSMPPPVAPKPSMPPPLPPKPSKR